MNKRMKVSKKAKQTIVLVVLLAMGIVLLTQTEKLKELSQGSKQEHIPTAVAAEEPFSVSVYPLTNNNIENGAATKVKWWFNENDGKYYIFLPSSADASKLQLEVTSAAEIFIDGTMVSQGEEFSVDIGTHEITTIAEEQTYQVEVMQSENVVSMFIDTESGSLDYLHTDKANEESGKITIFDATGKKEFAGEIEKIHCRGNASWEETDKKSYQFKLPRKTNLFHMGNAKKWLLLANAFDSTLLRNYVTFDYASQAGMDDTISAEYADLYINGEYKGNYLLTEKVEIGENRINIRDLEKETEALNTGKVLSEFKTFMTPQGRLFSTKGYEIESEPADITGGYLLEIEMSDRYGLEASGFITSRMQPVIFQSPVFASFDQVSYISNLYQDLEDAMFSEDGYSPYTGKYFGEYIDIESFAAKYLVEEINKNLDAAFTSQFFYKPDDKVSTKFIAGPSWDFDKSIAGSGITEAGVDLFEPTGFYANTKTKESAIWYALYQQEEFYQKVVELYHKDFRPAVKEEYETKINLYADTLLDSAMNDAYRWNKWPEAAAREEKEQNYYQKVEELTYFLEKRIAFLDGEWGGE